MIRTFTPVLFACLLCITASSAQKKGQQQPTNSQKSTTCIGRGNDWPNQEVSSIISPEERAAFKLLKNDEERDQYIEQFWYRRDPTPDTIENEYRDEYYKRVLYANEHFSNKQQPGYQSDRGLIYVKYGPPDNFEELTEQGQAVLLWRYRAIETLGTDIQIEFTDANNDGNFLLLIPVTAKDPSIIEKIRHRVVEPPFEPIPEERFAHLVVYVGPGSVARMQLPELEIMSTHRVTFTDVPFKLDYSFSHITQQTQQVKVKLTFDPAQLQWIDKNGSRSSHVQVFSRWTLPTGKIAQITEDNVSVDGADVQQGQVALTRTVYISSGTYRLDFVVKDVNADRYGTKVVGVKVPSLESCNDSNK